MARSGNPPRAYCDLLRLVETKVPGEGSRKAHTIETSEVFRVCKETSSPIGVIARSVFCDEAISLLNKGGDCFAKSARNDIISGSYSLTNP
jgi:hypothetical protein